MQEKTHRPDVQYNVDLFRPEDAQGIVRLFEAVYGKDYPIKLYYDPGKLTEANRKGDCRSVVARTPEGRIIGVHNLVRTAPHESTYEWAAGLVLKEYRSMGITDGIVDRLLDELVPRLGIEEVFGEPACTHVKIQKMSARLGFVETALELCLMPGSAYSKEGSALERVTTLLQFRCFKPKPHAVHLPRVYEKDLRFLYSAVDDERNLIPAEACGYEDARSEVRVQIFDFAQVARIAIHHAGQDLEARLEEIERDGISRNVVVFQAWVSLGAPAAASAVQTLRSRGYSIGGIMPRWFDADGMLMQRLLCRPDFHSIVLHSDRARSILEIVKKDWERSSGKV